MKNRGLALKLTVLILTSVTLIFTGIFAYNYVISRRIIIQNIEKNAYNMANATVNRIDMVLRSIEKVPGNVASFMESAPKVSTEITDLVRMIVTNNPEIYGATIAYEENGLSEGKPTLAPYCYKYRNELRLTYLNYDYIYWDWYQIPKELDRPAWTEPYYGESAGDIVTSTYSVPLYRTVDGNRKFMGVITADVSLEWLQKIVGSIKIAETGYGFILSKNGTFVTHPDPKLVMNETIFSVAEDRKDESMRELGRQMIGGKTGFTPFRSLVTGKQCWMVYAPLATNGWSLAVLFPQTELMADITRLNGTVLFLGITGFLIILGVIVWIAGTITRPIRALSRATEHVAVGNLNIELPAIASGDEVGRLTASFAAMKTSLQQYIQKLTETTAAKERIESELKIAHDIQMGMLPKTFPPFPERAEFDIYAAITPAKEVGGDLYDLFLMDENHLCFAIGDVSGKGVPAALFMAITRTLIKTKAVQVLSPGTVLTRVNEDLALENPSMMFVTLFLGILDIRSGEMEYCNAGHNSPYLLSKGKNPIALEPTGGLILGVEKDFQYRSKTARLEKGEALFLYTDGVTEAANAGEEMFSEAGLENRLSDLTDRPVEEIVSGVMEAVDAFVKDASQADDITMMALKFYGETSNRIRDTIERKPKS